MSQPTTKRKKKPKNNNSTSKKHFKKWIIHDWYKYCSAVIVGIAVYLSYIGYTESLVRTPFDKYKLVENAGLNERQRYWGSYRPLTYFGLKTRDPKSTVMGLMWHSCLDDSMVNPTSLRHWCEDGDDVVYGWSHHDGRTFGNQYINDFPFTMNTSFVKYSSESQYGGHWTTRIAVQNPKRIREATISLIWYIAIEDINNEYIQITPEVGVKLPTVTGETKSLGKFQLSFHVNRGRIVDSSYLSTVAPTFDQITSTVSRHLRWFANKKGGSLRKLPGKIISTNGVNKSEKPNFIAVQIIADAPFSIDICYQSLIEEPVPVPLRAQAYTNLLSAKIKEFDRRFDNTYLLKKKGFSDKEINFAKYALSNLLGGIGYFYGSSTVQSDYTTKPVPYWKAPLYTAVPSRSFFPRGFLWDEGFHGLLIASWDLDIELDIICHWFDLLNVEGWIPREQILGVEALSKVPAEFVTQKSSNANPPTFFLTFQRILTDHRQELNDMKRLKILEELYPRLDAWFNWFNTTQKGELIGTYLWRGRNATTDKELNPKSLSSGLDDYPRATHPTVQERHVDLLCWIGYAATVMSNLAQLLQKDDSKYYETKSFLTNNEFINKYHLNPQSGNYEDWGLHSNRVALTTAPRKRAVKRSVLAKPSYKFVDNVFGYVNIFPFLLQQLDNDSPHLKRILEKLRDRNLLWTNYGLRSLSKTSPYYMKRNTKDDPPYWRGQIWININFLAIKALHHYSEQSGPYANLAEEIYVELRRNVIQNVFREYEKTGFIWEQYDDVTGSGKGSHPFTGWSSLTVLMMAEKY